MMTNEQFGVQLPDLNHAAQDLAGHQFWQGEKNQINKHTLTQEEQNSLDLTEIQEDIQAAFLSIWLHTEFQSDLEKAQQLMDQAAGIRLIEKVQKGLSEQEQRKRLNLQAREILEKLLEHKFLCEKESEDVFTCAKAIVNQKLGQNFFISTEFERSEQFFKHALSLFDTVNDGLKLRFFNTLQEIYNTVGLIFGQREDYDMSIRYFLKAEELYNFIYDLTEGVGFQLPNTSFIQDFDLHLVSQIQSKTEQAQTRKSIGLVPETKAFSFYINGGLDKTKLERNYIETLRSMQFLYKTTGEQEQAIHLTAKVLHKELQQRKQCNTSSFNIFEWCQECLLLAKMYLNQSHFSQAEYCYLACEQVALHELKQVKEAFNNVDSDLQKFLSQIHVHLGAFYSEKLIFLIQNFNSNSEAIPEVVGFKAFEFPALADVIKDWPSIEDMQKEEDAIPTYNQAIRYLKKVVIHYQTLSQIAHLSLEDRNHWQQQQVKTLVEISRLQKIMSLIELQTESKQKDSTEK